MRVLIADDDPLIRRMVECIVRNADYDVLLASDGREAFQILQGEDPPKLAIIDWMMPGLDGLELCRTLRGLPTSAPTYVILVTGRDTQEDIVAGFHSGADDYVTKPIRKEQLQRRLAIGRRIVQLQSSLEARDRELAQALAELSRLRAGAPLTTPAPSWESIPQPPG
jgi:DNA-binding response OmpR family regulator